MKMKAALVDASLGGDEGGMTMGGFRSLELIIHGIREVAVRHDKPWILF
jgi:hypothetical protein